MMNTTQRTFALTLRALTLPLRDVPAVVNPDSASESSDTSSEHHCMHASRPGQKGQMMTTMLSKDRLIKARIRVPEIRERDTRTKN